MSDPVTGTGTGQSAAAAASAAQTAAPARTTTRKKSASRKTNGSAAATATDANNVTIAITLPRETHEWFKQAASQAPFEPSVQKYIAWELRQWAADRQKSKEECQDTTLGVNNLH